MVLTFTIWMLLFMSFSIFSKKLEMKMIQMITIVIISKLYISANLHEMEFFLDSMSMNLGHLSIILSCLAMTVYIYSNDSLKSTLCIISGITALVFFYSNNLLTFFIAFEASLIPLIILIIGWGKQPERLMAGKYIMIYTLFSSFPLLCFIIWVSENLGLFSMSNLTECNKYLILLPWPMPMSFLICLSFMLAFLVKVPMFFFHSWLPKAHVEAPLEGSIILAGIMLKVGIYGIFRLLIMFSTDTLNFISEMFFCVSLLGSVFSVMMAVSSDDLKLSIALSSVSHMNLLLSSLFSMKELTSSMANFIMISHGLSSSLLFFFVTMIYETNNTRSIALVKGSMSKVPSVLLFSFLLFSASMSLPPSLAFTGEMLSITSIQSFSTESIPLICIFIMTNSFYSMMNYGVMNHSAKSKTPQNSKLEIIFNVKSSMALMILVSTFFFPETML